MKTQRVAIITGGTGGMGTEISKRLAKDGFAVVINYAGKEKPADELIKDIEKNGGKAIKIQADITDSSAVKEMFKTVEKEFGRVDAIINTAGIMIPEAIADVKDEDLDKQININLKGTFNTMRESAHSLQENGRIINISSSVTDLKIENYAVYAATKAAVDVLTSVMAKELRGRNITVNSIAPGPTATPLFLKGQTKESIEQTAKMNPLERIGTTEDIANVVAFLISEEGAWINGQTLRANGGMI